MRTVFAFVVAAVVFGGAVSANDVTSVNHEPVLVENISTVAHGSCSANGTCAFGRGQVLRRTGARVRAGVRRVVQTPVRLLNRVRNWR